MVLSLESERFAKRWHRFLTLLSFDLTTGTHNSSRVIRLEWSRNDSGTRAMMICWVYHDMNCTRDLFLLLGVMFVAAILILSSEIRLGRLCSVVRICSSRSRTLGSPLWMTALSMSLTNFVIRFIRATICHEESSSKNLVRICLTSCRITSTPRERGMLCST